MNTPIPDKCPHCGASRFEREGWDVYQCGTRIGDNVQQYPQCIERQRDQLAVRVAVAEQERDQALALLGAYRMDKDALSARVKELEAERDHLRSWIDDLDEILRHSGKSEDREWKGDIGWLYKGQVAYVGEVKP